HWPVLNFAKIFWRTRLSWPFTGMLVLASVALSYSTYKFVETPLRHHRSTVLIPWLLASSVAGIGLFGLICFYKISGWPRLQSSSGGRLAAEASIDGTYPYTYNFSRRTGFQTGQVGVRTSDEVLFIGDSHAEQYYARVMALSERQPDALPASI